MSELNEVFDSEDTKYPIINMKPSSKVPQLWKIDAPGADNLAVRMCSYKSEGDVLRAVKQGDKYVHVVPMSLSKSMTVNQLKSGGFGDDPIGAMQSMFDAVYYQVKKLHIDAVMFRFPAKKMKGQEKALQRVIGRLAMSKTGGKFKVLPELYGFTKKYAYVLIYRKSTGLSDIKGIPDINTELYTSIPSDVGEVWVSKAKGVSVTKDEAIAGSIAAVEEKRNDQAVAMKSKLSRKDMFRIQYSMNYNNLSEDDRENLDKVRATEKVYSSEGALEDPVARHVSVVLDKMRKERGPMVDPDGKPSPGLTPDATSNNWAIDDAIFRGVISMDRSRNIEDPSQPNLSNEIKRDIADKLYREVAAVLDKTTQQTSYKDIRKIANLVIDSTPGAAAYVRANTLEQLISTIADGYYKELMKPAFFNESNKNLSKEQRRVIQSYCGSMYADINEFLIGETDTVKSVREEWIPTLDSAFEQGVRLPKGTILYRGHRMLSKDYFAMMVNKTFYFANYVSTSMYPIIFNDYAKVFASLDDTNAPTSDGGADPSVAVVSQSVTEVGASVRVGMVISGAENIRVVVPGELSGYPGECEVILPRGTVIKFNKFYGSGVREKEHALAEGQVLSEEEITEAAEIYDGDLFMETGELVPAQPTGFSSFLNANRVEQAEAEAYDKDEAMRLLAACISSNIPEKFMI